MMAHRLVPQIDIHVSAQTGVVRIRKRYVCKVAEHAGGHRARDNERRSSTTMKRGARLSDMLLQRGFAWRDRAAIAEISKMRRNSITKGSRLAIFYN